jgi:hypothetical protein
VVLGRRQERYDYYILASVPSDSLAVSDRRHIAAMSNAAPRPATAGNKFREVARATENPATKLLAKGLTARGGKSRESVD